MSVPKTVTKVRTIDGKPAVTFTSNVDRANYTIRELTKAALRDVGKYLVKAIAARAPKRTSNLSRSFASWNRTKDGQQVLQVGTYYSRNKAKDKGKGYAPYLHLVLHGHRATNGTTVAGNDFVMETVRDNIDTIREIEGKYLSAINDESEAVRIAEAAEKEGDTED